ncbi:MAG: hypothetical protein HYR94_04240 [Chloroflexi bacterium]|nr:hypothetical protein [Chloroflexota bacterium]
MKPHRDSEFNLRELAGSMGDFGTLFPLTVGLIMDFGRLYHAVLDALYILMEVTYNDRKHTRD